jgi:SAM-dependent methyltransferase
MAEMTCLVEREDEWLSVGAVDKAMSVEELVRGLSITSVLEVGCGTGAVLAEIIRRGIGFEYGACEPSPELCGQARARSYEADVDLRCATFDASQFDRRRWDLIVVSHVLEHTDDPAVLLAQVLAAAQFVIIEVPIEGTLMGGLRSLLRRAVTGRKRSDNAAGHIQFFSIKDVRRLVYWTGGGLLRTRSYFPRTTYRHMASRAVGWKRVYYRAWTIADRALGARLLTQLYYGHFAVLATQRRPGEEIGAHPLFWRPSA